MGDGGTTIERIVTVSVSTSTDSDAELLEKARNLGQGLERWVKRKKRYVPEETAEEEAKNLVQRFGGWDAQEFIDTYGVQGREAKWILDTFFDFGKEVLIIWNADRSLTSDEDAKARFQHWAYIAGDLGRNGTNCSQQKIRELACALHEATNDVDRKKVAFLHLGFESEKSQLGDEYTFNEVNDALKLRSLAGTKVFEKVRTYAQDFYGMESYVDHLFDAEDSDQKIKAILEGPDSPQKKIVDLMGRLAHLGWLVNVVGEDRMMKNNRYVNKFKSNPEMFGTYKMAMRALIAKDEKEGWENILKDYDQVRASMWWEKNEKNRSKNDNSNE